MPLLTVEGEYKDGMVKLSEQPQGVSQARVLVTFIPAEAPLKKSRQMYFGMFKGPVMTTEEDFKLAEWHGDKEDFGGE